MLFKNINLNYIKKNLSLIPLFVIILFCFFYIPKIFAELQPNETIEVLSKVLSYENKIEGAWKVTESAKWLSSDEVQLVFNVDTVLKNSNKKSDVLFVIDNSVSMNDEKLLVLKESLSNCIEKILSTNGNKVGLISFNESASVLSEFTDNKDELLTNVSGISPEGGTNYYNALLTVEKLLKDSYREPADKNISVIFLTTSHPEESYSSAKAEYQYIRSQFPDAHFTGVQYEMGNDITEFIKTVSEEQYVANKSNLINTLDDALLYSPTYEKFDIFSYINTDYFYFNEKNATETSHGNVQFDTEKQMIKWDLKNLKTSQKATLIVNINLKKEFIATGDLYTTNSNIVIESIIDNIHEKVDEITAPTVINSKIVEYDANAPSDCQVSNVPAKRKYYVNDTVEISDNIPKCDGYLFKGWYIKTEDINKMNDDYFIMPDKNVLIRGVWSKSKVKKTMTGTIKKGLDFYELLANDFKDSTKYVKKYTGDTSTFKGKDDIYYYHGPAANNNVIFAGYCWKIVRTTDTGGVKLLYAGVPNNGVCANSASSNVLSAEQMNTSSNKISFNSSQTSYASVGYMFNTRYETQSIGATSIGNVLYGGGFEYIDGKYILTNTKSANIVSAYSSLENYHYSCFNTTGECSTIYYVDMLYNNEKYTSKWIVYYLELNNGKSIEDALKEMLQSESTNKKDSLVKTGIDYWYSNNMAKYTNMLEDTVWCNDRTVAKTWNYQSMLNSYRFNASISGSSLSCPNEYDRFTVSSENGNGALKYPVGLITMQEYVMAFSESKNPLDVGGGANAWTMSPFEYRCAYGANYFTYKYASYTSSDRVDRQYYVRPAIALKSGVSFSSGDGSSNSPYIVSQN